MSLKSQMNRPTKSRQSTSGNVTNRVSKTIKSDIKKSKIMGTEDFCKRANRLLNSQYRPVQMPIQQHTSFITQLQEEKMIAKQLKSQGGTPAALLEESAMTHRSLIPREKRKDTGILPFKLGINFNVAAKELKRDIMHIEGIHENPKATDKHQTAHHSLKQTMLTQPRRGGYVGA